MRKVALQLFFLGMFLFACTSGLKVRLIDGLTIWNWGGSPGRTGYTEERGAPHYSLQWTRRLEGAVGRSMSVDGESLFIGTQKGDVEIVALVSGRRMEHLTLVKHGSITCLVGDSSLIAASRSGAPSLWVYDFLSGREMWHAVPGDIQGEPLLIRDHLVVVTYAGMCLAYSIRHGEQIWQSTLGAPGTGVAGMGQVVVAAAENGEIRAFDLAEGRLLWRTSMEAPCSATPMLADSLVLIGSRAGKFHAFRISDGNERWNFPTDGNIFTTAASEGGKVYFGTAKGTLYCLSCTTGEMIWMNEDSSPVGTQPLLSRRFICLGRLNGKIYLYNRDDGEEVWNYALKGRIRTAPIFSGKMLIAASENRYIYGFVQE